MLMRMLKFCKPSETTGKRMMVKTKFQWMKMELLTWNRSTAASMDTEYMDEGGIICSHNT